MSEGIRQRKLPNGATDDQPVKASISADDAEPAITPLDILRLIIGILLLNVMLSYFITGNSFTWGYNPWWMRPQVIQQLFRPNVNLTDSQLLAYDGSDPTKPVYLGLDGTIYDVSAGRHIYGPGGSYNYFAGRDASRAFITGCFAEDNVPDIRGAEWTFVPTDVPSFEDAPSNTLTPERRKYRRAMLHSARAQVNETLAGWAKMFRGDSGKKYFEVGKIWREEGWLERLPSRTLCKPAENARPKPKTKKADGGAAFRAS